MPGNRSRKVWRALGTTFSLEKDSGQDWSPQIEGAPLPQEMPWNRGRRARRALGEWCALHAVCALVLAVLVVLVLALGVTVGVQSAGRQGGNRDLPAVVVLGCPEEWVGYRNVCYYLSEDEGGWEWSQEQCSSRGASLAVLKMGWEMEFISRLKGNVDCWVGLRIRGERLEWVDGSSFNETIPVYGHGGCIYMNNNFLATSSCSLVWPYLCSKPQALM